MGGGKIGGFGRRAEAAAQALRLTPGFDRTVVLSMANLAVFVSVVLSSGWHVESTRNGESGTVGAAAELPPVARAASGRKGGTA
jgi:hypothetical protein